MIEPGDGGSKLDEGGREDREDRRAERAAMLDRIAAAEPSELAALWLRAVAEWGDEASRIWQEALSATDASET